MSRAVSREVHAVELKLNLNYTLLYDIISVAETKLRFCRVVLAMYLWILGRKVFSANKWLFSFVVFL